MWAVGTFDAPLQLNVKRCASFSFHSLNVINKTTSGSFVTCFLLPLILLTCVVPQCVFKIMTINAQLFVGLFGGFFGEGHTMSLCPSLKKKMNMNTQANKNIP